MRKTVEWLVNEYQKSLFAASYAICGNAEDARDAVQDTFIRYYTSKKEFNDDGSMKERIMFNKMDMGGRFSVEAYNYGEERVYGTFEMERK